MITYTIWYLFCCLISTIDHLMFYWCLIEVFFYFTHRHCVHVPLSCVFKATHPGLLKVSGLQAGVYTFKMTVTDTAGQKSSDDVSVTVLAPKHQAEGKLHPDVLLLSVSNQVVLSWCYEWQREALWAEKSLSLQSSVFIYCYMCTHFIYCSFFYCLNS